MLKKKTGIILLISCVLVIFFGILGFLQYKLTPKEAVSSTANEDTNENAIGYFEVFSVETNDITGLAITNSKGSFSIENQDGKWISKGSEDINLYQKKIAELVEKLRCLNASQILEGHAASEYGLNTPTYEYVLETADISFDFKFGITNPVSGDIYCMIDGVESYIYTCPKDIIELLDSELAQYCE